MSDAAMRKSYSVVCIRSSGRSMEHKTVPDYQSAVKAAKEAVSNKSNPEVHIVENTYDQTTRQDRKKVVKILTHQNAGPVSSSAKKKTVVTRETANHATKSVINIVIAVTVLILLIGIMIPLITR